MNPLPKFLVDPDWHASERELIVAYLKSGQKCTQWSGYSSCRFGCFCEQNYPQLDSTEQERLFQGLIQEIGSHDFTDEEWIWPEGLAHYVQKHHVCLPEPFVSTMRKNCWSVPKIQGETGLGRGMNVMYWIMWAIEKHQSMS